jgi:hypothetical protein
MLRPELWGLSIPCCGADNDDDNNNNNNDNSNSKSNSNRNNKNSSEQASGDGALPGSPRPQAYSAPESTLVTPRTAAQGQLAHAPRLRYIDSSIHSKWRRVDIWGRPASSEVKRDFVTGGAFLPRALVEDKQCLIAGRESTPGASNLKAYVRRQRGAPLRQREDQVIWSSRLVHSPLITCIVMIDFSHRYSQQVAGLRAEESRRPDALFTDPLAAWLADGVTASHAHFLFRASPNDREGRTEEEEVRLREVVAELERDREARPYVAVRTRWLDDFIQKEVSVAPEDLLARDAKDRDSHRCVDRKSHAEHTSEVQLVILGCGLDSRPYRLPGLRGCAVFELDHPEVIAYKEARLAQLNSDTPLFRPQSEAVVRRVGVSLTAPVSAVEGTGSASPVWLVRLQDAGDNNLNIS